MKRIKFPVGDTPLGCATGLIVSVLLKTLQIYFNSGCNLEVKKTTQADAVANFVTKELSPFLVSVYYCRYTVLGTAEVLRRRSKTG